MKHSLGEWNEDEQEAWVEYQNNMGTNYYIKINDCKSCGRFDEIHLGKSSHGWQFSFQYNGGLYYKNVSEMKKWLKDKIITNEYGEVVTYKEFWNMVTSKQKTGKNHAAYVKKEYPTSSEHEHIIGGFSFSDVEFS